MTTKTLSRPSGAATFAGAQSIPLSFTAKGGTGSKGAMNHAPAYWTGIFANQRGQALTETAIVIGLFLTLTMGIIEFGRAWMIANMITHAARDGARSAAVVGSASRTTDTHIIVDSLIMNGIKSQVQTEMQPVLGGSALQVELITDTVTDGVPLVQIRVHGQVPYIFNLVGTSFDVDRTVSFRDEGR